MKNFELDKGLETYSSIKSKCSKCLFLDIADFTCHAFPDGVPGIYLSGESIHDKVVDSQKGDYIFTPWS